jgi:hypothetical protein
LIEDLKNGMYMLALGIGGASGSEIPIQLRNNPTQLDIHPVIAKLSLIHIMVQK